MDFAGDDGSSGWSGEREKTVPGGLDETTSLESDVEKELGVVLARKWPETGTSSTSWDNNIEARDFTDRAGKWLRSVVAQGGGSMSW